MKRNFTFLMTAFALMVSMMMPLGMKGQTRATLADQMMASDLAATSTTYTDFSGVTLNSDAVYAGQSAKDSSGNIQLRSKNSNSGIVSTTSGGKIKSVKITVASENSNTIDVYGSNTAYTSAANLYSTSGNNNQGTKLGSLTSTGTITVTGDYAYVGVRSNSGAVYISSIEFTWESTGGGTPAPTPCTVTFNPGNGTCDTPSVTEDSGTSITLPTASPSTECANAGWSFAGWATQSISETTTAPTLLTGSYTISGNVTLYAVYKDSDQQITVFNIADIASENGWENGIRYTTISLEGVTLTATGGENDGKYYNSDNTWRFYKSSNGTVTVSAFNNDVVGVTSNPQTTFTISNGGASYVSSSSNTSFKSITVICGALTCTYATSPNCLEQVATPTFSPAAGTYTEVQNVTINCATSGATIYYTTDGSTPNTSSSVYSSAIPVSSNTTIKAIAVKEGVSSEVATASYVFVNPAAKTANYTITTTTSVSATGTVPSGSSASFVNTYTENKFQLTAGKSMTLTLSGYQGKVVTGVVLSMKSNKSSGAGSLSITAGSSQLASISGTFNPNWYSEWTTAFVDVNVPMTDDDYCIQSGEQLVITIEATTNSLYCQSFTIQYEDDVNPRIIVTAPDPLAYDATSGAFNYSISNPVQGTSLQASSNADWISDIQVGDAQVTFTTTVNDTYLERNGTITLTYGTKTKDVIITQAALVPAITISDAPTDAFSYEGDYGSFSFSIDHFVDGAIASAYSAEYWIRNFEVSDDMVYFEVAPSIEDARSGNITLSYMLNGATLALVTVPINQETNPNEHGSFERPYTVSEAWAIINHMDDGVTADDSVYVAGTISQIEQVEVIQYHNAIYKITDGSKSLYVRYGRNLDDTDFYDEDEIQVGDRVVICGKLQKHSSNPKYRIAEYNYLVSLERDVEPPLFNPTSCMMANDEAAVVYLYTNNGEEVVIYYTTNGNDPTISSEIYSGDSGISLQGLTDEVTIKAIAYTLDGTMHSAVNSATYRMVPPYTHGLYDHPFTVQQALDSLDVSSTIEGVYVRGVVCADPEFSLSNFMNANYYIADNLGDDNQLYVFRGRYYGGEPFTSQEELMYGDIVTVFGDLAIYNGQVKEFTAKNYIVSKERPSSIIIRPSEVSTNCRGISSSLNVYYNNLNYISSRDLQFCDAQGNQVEASTYSWLTATMNTSTGNINFQIEDNDSNAPRTAYLKLVVMEYGNPTPFVSNVVPITQGICSADEFATLPFNYVGDEAVPAGITKVGLGENYGSSPYLKFDGVNDYMTLAFDEAPGELTFNIKGDKFKSSEFYLQTSTNNLDWDDLAIYTTQDMINSWAADNPKREIARVIGDPMGQSFPELNANVRYIRWIMMTHSSGSNVRLGEIHLSKPVIYYNIAVTQPTIEETQVGTITTSEMAQENETVNLSIEYNADDYYFVEWVVTDDSDNPVAVTGNHFTMPAANVTVTATLVSVNTPCAYAFSVNGQMGDQQSGTVGNAVQMPTNSDITFNGQTFTFRGWTTDANNVTNLLLPGSSFTMLHDETFYAVYQQTVAGTEAEKQYAKVTRELSDWSGDYLIVYETDNVAFNGALETLDAASNTVAVTISNGIINATETMNAAKFTIAAAPNNNYSIKSASGKYIGKNADGNGLDEDETTAYKNSISYNEDNGEIDIIGEGGAYLRFNKTSGQNRFRYYKSSTYTDQQPIQLYKYVGSVNNLYTRIFMNETASSVTIEGPSLIPEGSVLNAITLSNTLGADRLLVDEGGQLVTSNNVNATVRKTITPYAEEHGTDNYYLISTPVDGQDPTEANMTDGAFDLYSFDQTQQGKEWQNYEANAFALQSGKGYLYANEYGGNIVMAGQMNGAANGVTISQASGKPFAGWNLIGNPYPCNVTINKPFYRLAEGGAALATDATAESIAIAPMEGVFVYADGQEEDITFTKAPAISTTGSGRSTLNLRVSRNRDAKGGRRVEDNAIVRFGEGGLLRKLVLSPDLSQLYVTQDGIDYAIVNAEAEGELPVSFRAAEDGSYTLTVAAEGVCFNYLHLIDHKTGADVDLLAPFIARNEAIQEPVSYTFTAKTTDYASRFRLVFGVDAASGNVCEPSFAFFNGSQWIINNDGHATLQVVDMMGRVLSSQAINGHAEISIHEAQGVYLLRLLDGDSVKVQKIIIHN